MKAIAFLQLSAVMERERYNKLKKMNVTFRHIGDRLERDIKSAKENILIAVAWFTNDNIFELLLDLIQNGISVELVVNNDHINNRENGLDFNKFIKLGGKFYFADNSRLMHHYPQFEKS